MARRGPIANDSENQNNPPEAPPAAPSQKIAALELARRFVANAPIDLTLTDLDGRLLELSPGFVAAFVNGSGYTRETLIGADVRAFDQNSEISFSEIADRLAHGEPHVQVLQRLVMPEGEHRCSRARASYWREASGSPAAILFTHQDVTAEIEAEAARRESEERIRAVIDNLPLQIALLGLDTGRVELLNAKFEGDLSDVRASMVGRPIEELLAPAMLARLGDVVARAEANGGMFEEEGPFTFGDGRERIARMKRVLIRDRHGRRQLLWTAEDITELRRSTEALQRAVAEAEAANSAKSEFLANMSHEIRTPLNGVMGVAGALAKTDLSPDQREMVALIETSGRTLETLLSDILDLARIEAGKMELRPEPFDLATSVNACTALFDAAAQAKGLDLEVSIEPAALGAYVGDAARVRQILANLLGNAVKFTQVGKVSLAVSAVRGETRSELAFEVRDTGIGFDAETKARLFSRFEQADGSITRRFGGSGLGLSISRSLAEAMGGRLEGHAEPDEGAVFTLTLNLPRCAGAADLWCGDADPEPASDPLVGLRVLLAEDHPTNRRVVELILGAAGVDLTCVENGVEAVDAFRRGAFDLILMDMQMPLLDGLSAIEEIRRLEARAGAAPTPIHVLTANAMPEHISASVAAGADGHLSKPILADALLERVAQAAAASTPAHRAVAAGRLRAGS